MTYKQLPDEALEEEELLAIACSDNLSAQDSAPQAISEQLATPAPAPDKLPDKIHNAYWFQGFNAVSWQICLGSPLILFATGLGAPAVVLGLLAGLSPLTSVLQLFVAPHAERIGYRNLMVKGWTSRVMTLVFLTLLPLSVAYLPAPVVITLLVLIMTAFTTLRGIATCAWLPWNTAIVPKSLRGYYLSRDRTFVNVATVAALAVAGLFLFDQGNMVAYSLVFGVSFLGGAVSLYFLNRVPDPSCGAEKPPKPASRTNWLGMLRDDTFLRLVMFSAAVQTFVASIATFVTVFVRDVVDLPDGTILWLSAGAALTAALSMPFLRNRVDRMGSRPFLGVVFLWWVFYFAAWFLLAAGCIGNAQLIAPALLLLAGFFAGIYDLALTRLLMNTVGDRPGNAQYFALHSVLISIMLGISPILWGLLLDTLKTHLYEFAGLALNGYAVFFGLQFLTLGLVLAAFVRLREPSATRTGVLLYRALVTAPTRRLAHLTARAR